MRKILVTLLLILFGTVGVVGFWHYQKNKYSKEILKLEILSQDFVEAGEVVEYLVRYKNNGSVVLEDPELIFEYPENSLPEDDNDLRYAEKIEDIYPGEEGNFTFKTRIFGQEGELALARAWLSYRPRNLKARFESKTTKTSQIKFVPLTFEFDLPSKIESDENLRFSLNYFSNMDYLLENLRVNVEYPDGFNFSSASPPGLDELDWDLPSLFKGGGGRIKIQGTIKGEVGAQKIFRAKIGLIKDGQFLVLKKALATIQIVEPSLYISQTVNGLSNFVSNTSDLLHYEVFFKNIGRAPIQKKFLLVKLEPGLFDLSTLKSDRGESGPGDNSIIFDWRKIAKLKFLEAGEEGKVEFWVRVKGEGAFEGLKNPVLRNEVKIGDIKKEFEVKVNSRLSVAQKVYFQDDFFENFGSLPPRVGQTTNYTIWWQVANLWNDVKNVKVKSVLPQNVKPTGKIFPEEAKFTFDPESKEAIWNIGDLESWTGVATPLTLAFQIEFTPDNSQRGKIPVLVAETTVVGEDGFTGELLQGTSQPVDASLPDDETVTEEQGMVE